MSQCSEKREVKIKQRSCVSDIFRLSPSSRMDWLFSSFRRKMIHVYSYTLMLLVRVCRLSFSHASTLSGTKLGPDSRQGILSSSALFLPYSPVSWEAEDGKEKRCVVHCLWSGIRCTSLPTLPTVPIKSLPFW